VAPAGQANARLIIPPRSILGSALSAYSIVKAVRLAGTYSDRRGGLPWDHHYWGSEVLSAAKIIAHHKFVLNDFGAGDHVIKLKPTDQIVL